MRKINLIVIHCSATRVTQDFTVGELEACHLARGFRDIGYHYYITKDGVIYPCRPESEPGTHARHYNAHSIGICYEGGLDADGRPADHVSMSRSGFQTFISTSSLLLSSNINFRTHLFPPQSYVLRIRLGLYRIFSHADLAFPSAADFQFADDADLKQ